MVPLDRVAELKGQSQNMNNLKLRKATTKDSEFAFQTKKAAMKEYIEKAFGWDEKEQRQLHARRFNSLEFEIMQVSGINVGILSVDRQPDFIKVNQIYVLPKYQNNGIEAECMIGIIKEASDLNVPVKLQVLKVNTRALAFYKRLGFEITSETDTHYLMARL